MGEFVSLVYVTKASKIRLLLEKLRVGFGDGGRWSSSGQDCGGWAPQIKHLPEEAGLHAFQEAEARA